MERIQPTQFITLLARYGWSALRMQCASEQSQWAAGRQAVRQRRSVMQPGPPHTMLYKTPSHAVSPSR